VDGAAVLRSLALPFALLTTLTLTSSNPAPLAPPVAVGYQELLSHREVTLYYPGSRVLNFYGNAEYPERCQSTPSLMCVRADVPASISTILTAPATASADVFLWYQEQLSRRGWRPGYSNADETRVYERAPGEAFRLVVQTPETSRTLLGGTEALIDYDTSYFLSTCPSIDAGCRTKIEPPPANHVRPDDHLYFPRSVLMGADGSPSGPSGLWIRAYLVASAGSRDAVVGWYDRTFGSHGWSKGPSMPWLLEYRHGSEDLVVTFTSSPSQLGYAVTGVGYTAVYSVDTCAGNPLPICG
jgi:hypothetical protein